MVPNLMVSYVALYWCQTTEEMSWHFLRMVRVLVPSLMRYGWYLGSFFLPSLMPYGGIMRRVRVGVKVHNGEVEVINRFL